MSCFFNVLRNLIFTSNVIDSYSKLCIFYPSFDLSFKFIYIYIIFFGEAVLFCPRSRSTPVVVLAIFLTPIRVYCHNNNNYKNNNNNYYYYYCLLT